MIIITVTDYDFTKSEERYITEAEDVDGKTVLTLDEPLKNKHFAGDIEISDDWT